MVVVDEPQCAYWAGAAEDALLRDLGLEGQVGLKTYSCQHKPG